jgi:hypothetical protein
MSTNHELNGEDELRAARRTAFALGQIEGAEQAEVAAEVAASPQAREEVEAVQDLAVRLNEATQAVSQPEPSAALREAVQRRLAELELVGGRATVAGSMRPWWRSPLFALAVSAACFAALVIPIARSTNYFWLGKSRDVAIEQPIPKSQPEPGDRHNPGTDHLLGSISVRVPPSGPREVTVPSSGQSRPDAKLEMESSSEYSGITIEPGQSVRSPKPGVGQLHSNAIILTNGATLSANGPPGFNFNNGRFAGKDSTITDLTRETLQKEAKTFNWDVSGVASSRINVSGQGVPPPGPSADLNGKAPEGTTYTGAASINAGVLQTKEGQVVLSKDAANALDRSHVANGYLSPSPNGDRGGQDSTTTDNTRVNVIGMARANNLRLEGDRTKNVDGQPPLELNVNTLEESRVIKALAEIHDNLSAKVASPEKEMAMRKAIQDFVGKRNSASAASRSRDADIDRLIPNGTTVEEAARNTKQSKPSQEKPTPSAKKALETWKPAHVVPNSSRLMVGENEELPLKGMQVDVRVDGFRARVLIDLYYCNDRPQQLEGNFQLRLPDEAAPYFFAFGRTVYQAPQVTAGDSMFFKPQQVSQGDTTPEKILALREKTWEQPKVARMVPKEKAAMAYRDTVRRRIDPALVEWAGAGVFQCRVFPLAPQSLHRVTVGYDVDLLRVGEDLELRLDLPGQTPATLVDLNIAASDARQVSLDAPATVSADGQRLSYRLVDPKDRPLVVRLRKPGTPMLTGNDEATGNYFATRVDLALPAAPATERAKQAVFLIDTSLSAGPQFPLWTKLLRATLENNRDSIREFAVLFFNVETFWWQEKFVANTPENVEALMHHADELALEGATDLGRALQAAASPAWLKGATNSGPSSDIFLLGDGAATWGEDRWPLLATSLKAGSPFFAYRTGMAGGDPRLLAYLAERTGGAVFALVSEAEIAAASVAHRNRSWRLTGIEMAGGHDLLVAGRPQYVFPGQQLLVAGRLEQNPTDRSGRADPQSLVFTLQQGRATQTITVKLDHALRSELAARVFGQVATNQLEDVCGVTAAVEPVATAYARHFRVTGRTCSLLMLESEQDYARFNIKPEEDSFVVKDRPAGMIVAKAVTETTAAVSDPKASFLAWYRWLIGSSMVHFDLPASLNVALEGMPVEAFAVAVPPLQCKLRLRNDLPENFRQLWRSGLPEYETLAAEAERRLTACGADDALRGLSSLIEDRPGDPALARDLAFSAIAWQRPGEAYHLLRRAAAARSFEPITFHAMAHCLEQMGRADMAVVYYELACGGQWDGRFGDMHNVAQLDYLRFLRRIANSQEKGSLREYAKARMATLAALQLRDTADLATLIFWNTDGTDVDLHVTEPSGEECSYQHTQTASGGHISRDVTAGYGPELYLLPTAPAGLYRLAAHYFAADANRLSTRTKVLALIYEGWGTKDEKLTVKSTALTGRSEKHELATIKR